MSARVCVYCGGNATTYDGCCARCAARRALEPRTPPPALSSCPACDVDHDRIACPGRPRHTCGTGTGPDDCRACRLEIREAEAEADRLEAATMTCPACGGDVDSDADETEHVDHESYHPDCAPLPDEEI